MPNSILEKFKRSARFEDNIWEDEYGDEFMYETAIVAIKTTDALTSPNHNSTILTTKWYQRTPYNYLLPNNNPLGCVTIAVAQIMRYHEFPKKYSWSNMPNVLVTATDCDLTRFLKIVHDELGVTNGGSAFDTDAKRVLESYGYTVQKKSHEYGVYKYPCYCSGFSSTLDLTGHAWVCDGEIRPGYWRVDYELYVFDNAYYPKFKYMLLDSDMEQSSGSAGLFHMNWGWGDTSGEDGYYYDGSLNVNKTNYNYRRVDLFITKP